MSERDANPDQIKDWIKVENNYPTFQAETWVHRHKECKLIAEEENMVVNRTTPNWRVTFLPAGYEPNNDMDTVRVRQACSTKAEAVRKLHEILRNDGVLNAVVEEW